MNIKTIFKKHFLLDCKHEQLNRLNDYKSNISWFKSRRQLWECCDCKRRFALNLYMSEVKE